VAPALASRQTGEVPTGFGVNDSLTTAADPAGEGVSLFYRRGTFVDMKNGLIPMVSDILLTCLFNWCG